MKENVKGCPIKTRGLTFPGHISILAVLHFWPYRLQAEMSERY